MDSSHSQLFYTLLNQLSLVATCTCLVPSNYRAQSYPQTRADYTPALRRSQQRHLAPRTTISLHGRSITVLTYLCRSLSTQLFEDSAQILGCSEEKVQKFKQNALSRLGPMKRSQLAAYVIFRKSAYPSGYVRALKMFLQPRDTPSKCPYQDYGLAQMVVAYRCIIGLVGAWLERFSFQLRGSPLREQLQQGQQQHIFFYANFLASVGLTM